MACTGAGGVGALTTAAAAEAHVFRRLDRAAGFFLPAALELTDKGFPGCGDLCLCDTDLMPEPSTIIADVESSFSGRSACGGVFSSIGVQLLNALIAFLALADAARLERR